MMSCLVESLCFSLAWYKARVKSTRWTSHIENSAEELFDITSALGFLLILADVVLFCAFIKLSKIFEQVRSRSREAFPLPQGIKKWQTGFGSHNIPLRRSITPDKWWRNVTLRFSFQRCQTVVRVKPLMSDMADGDEIANHPRWL